MATPHPHRTSFTAAPSVSPRPPPPATTSSSVHATGSFPYGVRASKLVDDLKHADWLPVYDEEAVRQVIEEANTLEKLIEDLAPGREIAPLVNNVSLLTTILTLDHCKERNKRCLIAYHQYRFEALERLYWERGMPVLDKRFTDKLSSREIDYYRDYVDCVTNLAMNIDMDLLSDMSPPKDLIVEVRALREFGDVMTEFGFVRLTKDSTHFMRRRDAEPLIRQNVLEQI